MFNMSERLAKAIQDNWTKLGPLRSCKLPSLDSQKEPSKQDGAISGNLLPQPRSALYLLQFLPALCIYLSLTCSLKIMDSPRFWLFTCLHVMKLSWRSCGCTLKALALKVHSANWHFGLGFTFEASWFSSLVTAVCVKEEQNHLPFP